MTKPAPPDLDAKRLRKMRAEANESLNAPTHTDWFHPSELEVLALLDRVERAEGQAQFWKLISRSRKQAALDADGRERQWRGLYDEAESAHTAVEARLTRVRVALTDMQGRGRRLMDEPNDKSVRSIERTGRADGYLEAARIGLEALEADAT